MFLQYFLLIVLLAPYIRSENDYCPATGIKYFPHYSNCSKFFECDDGVKILMNCPGNTAWSIDAEKCLEKDQVDCSYTTSAPPSTTPTPDDQQCPAKGTSFLPHLSDCTKYFECDDGVKTLEQCPNGEAWSISINACDFIKNVDCSYTTSAPTESPDNDKCPASGVSYIPDYGDCSSFYECREGVKTLKTCPDYYAWDIQLEACAEEEDVDCSYTTINPDSTTTGTTIVPTEPPTGWTPDPLCPYPSSVSVYLPDPYNCSQFFECKNGIKTTMSCPTDYTFDNIKKECEPEDEVDCSYTSTTFTPTSKPIPPPNGMCKGQPDGTVLVHPYDCTKYIECLGGFELVYPCPSGSSWSDSQKTCNTDNEENCKDTSTPITQITTVTTGTTASSAPTPPPNNACTGQPDGSFLPYSGDCTKFIECESGEQIIYACATGTSWNVNKKDCDDNNAENCKDNSTTTARPTGTTTSPMSSTVTPSGPTPSPSSTCKGQPNGSFLPFPGNCTRFIMCEDEEEIIYQCDTGTSWNVNKNACDTNNEENCKNDFTTTPGPTGVTTTKPTGTTTRTTRPTGTTRPRTTIIPPDVNTCKGQPDGTLLPYPNDSHKYIECINGIPVVYPCPNGSTWDQNNKSCSSSIRQMRYQ